MCAISTNLTWFTRPERVGSADETFFFFIYSTADEIIARNTSCAKGDSVITSGSVFWGRCGLLIVHVLSLGSSPAFWLHNVPMSWGSQSETCIKMVVVCSQEHE